MGQSGGRTQRKVPEGRGVPALKETNRAEQPPLSDETRWLDHIHLHTLPATVCPHTPALWKGTAGLIAYFG